MGWIFSPGGIFTWRNFHIDSDFHMVEFHIDSDFQIDSDFHLAEFSNAFGFFTLVRIFQLSYFPT